LISQLDFEQIDRTSFIRTAASNRFHTDPIIYADIGARGGLLAHLLPFDQIIAPIYFEPDPEEFIRLKNSISEKKARLFNTAVSNRAGDQTLYLTKKRGGSSILHPSGHMLGLMAIDGEGIKRFDVENEAIIQTQPLDKVFSANEIKLDVLKIDTQGSEYEILSTLADQRPFLICAECATTEIYKSQKSLFAIGSMLEKIGYFPVALMDGNLISKTKARWRRSIQLYGDVVFVPNNSAQGREIIARDVEKWFASLCMHGFMDFALWQIEELKIAKPALVNETEELLRKS
jgi:FkbM family methyltransferase